MTERTSIVSSRIQSRHKGPSGRLTPRGFVFTQSHVKEWLR